MQGAALGCEGLRVLAPSPSSGCAGSVVGCEGFRTFVGTECVLILRVCW